MTIENDCKRNFGLDQRLFEEMVLTLLPAGLKAVDANDRRTATSATVLVFTKSFDRLWKRSTYGLGSFRNRICTHVPARYDTEISVVIGECLGQPQFDIGQPVDA